MRNAVYEQFLTRAGYDFEYVEFVKFDDIDLTYGEKNPARLNAELDYQRAALYAEQMKQGDKFPAIILMTPSFKGVRPFDVATGMHRISGYILASFEGCDAYVVRVVEPFRRDWLVTSANMVEGCGPSVKERMLQAIRFHNTYPEKTLTSICHEWGLKISTVQALYRAESAKKRALGIGIDLSDDNTRLSQSVLGRLGLMHSNRVFYETCNFIINHNPASATVDELVKEVARERDEDNAVGIVHRYRVEAEEEATRRKAKSGRMPKSPLSKALQCAIQFNNIVNKGLEHLFISSLDTPVSRRNAKARLEEQIQNSRRILAEIERNEQLEATAVIARPIVRRQDPDDNRPSA